MLRNAHSCMLLTATSIGVSALNLTTDVVIMAAMPERWLVFLTSTVCHMTHLIRVGMEGVTLCYCMASPRDGAACVIQVTLIMHVAACMTIRGRHMILCMKRMA
jgi:hypothetical protein